VRLFVAVWPSADLTARLAALPRPEVEGVRWTGAERCHVTLDFLGEVSDLEGARAAFAGAAPLASVTARAGPATRFMGRKLLCVPVAGLDGLAERARSALQALGPRRKQREFLGHLTVARSRRPMPRELAGAPISGSWEVSELTLVSSTLGRGGPRYEVIDALPLT
jgi:2'-5' RNA ligase